MKISDLLNKTGLGSLQAPVQKDPQQEVANKTAEVEGGGADKVSISPVARQMQQMQAILAEDEAARATKVAELKEKIDSGEFKVDSKDVARSLVDFAREAQI